MACLYKQRCKLLPARDNYVRVHGVCMWRDGSALLTWSKAENYKLINEALRNEQDIFDTNDS